ncbi:hypothetical protein Hdeb2414_s0015g00441211 [Helianthus debilis subsp. tardiflorus]
MTATTSHRKSTKLNHGSSYNSNLILGIKDSTEKFLKSSCLPRISGCQVKASSQAPNAGEVLPRDLRGLFRSSRLIYH